MYLKTDPGVPPAEPGRDESCLFGDGVPLTVPCKKKLNKKHE